MSNADMHLFYNSQNRCSLPITLHTSREVPPINVNSNGGWQSAKRQTHEDSVHVPFMNYLYWEFHETSLVCLRMDNRKLVAKWRAAFYYLSKELH